ncbi:MAG: hypothetical protein GX456_15835 [Verrucomicrobia bacterium]|nr:hypothetical protein [Verrucomicrobiota bacterium]
MTDSLTKNFEKRRRDLLGKLLGPFHAASLPAEPGRQAVILVCWLRVRGWRVGWAEPSDIIVLDDDGCRPPADVRRVVEMFADELLAYFQKHKTPPVNLPPGPVPNFSMAEASELIGQAFKPPGLDRLTVFESREWAEWRAARLFEHAGPEHRTLPSWLWLAQAADELTRWRLLHP